MFDNDFVKLSSVPSGLQHMRLSIFCANQPADCSALFQDFFGVAPDQEVRKSGFVSEVSANTAGVARSLSAVGGKIDFIFGSELSADDIVTGFSVLPNSSPNRSQFVTSSQAILLRLPAIYRIAVGERYHWPASSREESYAKLAEMVPALQGHIEGYSDLVFRINRAREKSFEGHPLLINRISEWVSVAIQSVVQSDSISAPQIIFQAATVTTDISTPPGTVLNNIPTINKEEVLQTLFDFSAEFHMRGDIP